MKLLISTQEDEDKICLSDVSLGDMNTKSPIFTTEDKFNANFLHGSSCLHLRGCERFVLMDNYDLQTAVLDRKREMVKLLSGTAIGHPPPLKPGFTVEARINCSGFGKEWEKGDFRVIRNVRFWHNNRKDDVVSTESRFEIFSMRRGKWKELKDTSTLPAGAILNAFGSILINDVYYWTATSLPVPGRWGIVGFNFTKQKFMFWGLSSKVEQGSCLHLIKLQDGTLGLISYTNPRHLTWKKFVIWAVQQEGGETGFVKRYSFNLPQHIRAPVGFIGGCGLLFLVEDLTKTPTARLYRLYVYNVSKPSSPKPLQFYSRGESIQVISFEGEEGGEEQLPRALPLSECNDESSWNAYWHKRLPHRYGDGSGGSHGEPSRPCDGGGRSGDGDGDGDGSRDVDGRCDGDGDAMVVMAAAVATTATATTFPPTS